jgi:hypothetical protein
VDRTEPPDLSPVLDRTDRKLAVHPLLLNKGDSLRVKALVADFEEDVRVDARIEDVTRLVDLDDPKQGSLWKRIPGGLKFAGRSHSWWSGSSHWLFYKSTLSSIATRIATMSRDFRWTRDHLFASPCLRHAASLSDSLKRM